MFGEINVEYVILIALLIILGFYIYKERDVVEGLDSKKDPQIKEFKEKFDKEHKSCPKQHKKLFQEIQNAVETYIEWYGEGECQSIDPLTLTDEMYDSTETIILHAYNTAGELLAGRVIYDFIVGLRNSNIYNGFQGAKSPQDSMKSAVLEIESLLMLRKASLEALKYLQEGDSVDADGLHSIYDKDPSRAPSSSSSTSKGGSAFKSFGSSKSGAGKAKAKEAKAKEKAKEKEAQSKAKAKAEAAKTKAKLKHMF